MSCSRSFRPHAWIHSLLEIGRIVENPIIADAAELGVSPRIRDEAERVVRETQERFVNAVADAADMASSSHEERCGRSRSPMRHSPVCVGGHELPVDFLAAVQDLFWPVEFHERDRPPDLVTLESSLSPTMRMAPLDQTIDIVALILSLRHVAVLRRPGQATAVLLRSCPVVPNPNVVLTRDEVGVVMDFWKSKFQEQTATQQEAEQDSRENCSRDQMRIRMSNRFDAYMDRTLGNRRLGMALITLGFKVELDKLATAYAKEKADGDASSLPSRDLRQRTLEARAWYRWGRQLFNSVESDEVAWDSLEPTAQEAYRWFVEGWSAKECDRLTQEYGHGMLRSGCANGSFVGQQARGSVVDRLRMQFLDECL